MANYKERGLFELYRDDPERADALMFGRRTGVGRRGFLKGAGLTAMSAAIGAPLAFADRFPGGIVPAAMAQGSPAPKLLKMDGKAELVILGDRPLVAETPEHMLDDDITPNDKFFIRNNGQIPAATANGDAWEITIDGEVNKPFKIAVGDLKKRFPVVRHQLQLECGGNGRNAFTPQASGNQWGNGAIGNAVWTGVRLADVLKAAEPKSGAIYTAHHGADLHLSGEAGRAAISRGVRLEKAMEPHTLIAFAMNGQPIPQIHGFPVRLLVPGWPGSASQKWLSRVQVRDKEHDGQGMTGTSYRVPIVPMVPGSKPENSNFRILESMPVRSVITNVPNGTTLPAGTRKLELRGKAWAGERSVRAVHVSIDHGGSWLQADVSAPANKYAWQKWSRSVDLPSQGYYEIVCRAQDSAGMMQTISAANWNPQGYGGNVVHRIAVVVPA